MVKNSALKKLQDIPKRLVDFLMSILSLIILAPLIISIAIWTRLSEGSPVFFRQRRVGLAGKPFLIWKFRTMSIERPGFHVTTANDPRITPTGRLLRKWKFDELPQLLNVINGTMSLVGPRPEVPEFVDLADPIWREVLAVRPGITDWATIAHLREEENLTTAGDPEQYYLQYSLPRKLRVCLHYVRHRSFWVDLKILWLTVLSLIKLFAGSPPQQHQ